ncbi:4-alpha-glucanotransferase [Candidatus Pantoea soli]|uniref:4-alpha-glucanotransferase n=1 Tax=Candidatus Pantoea soli TaxID=3098669 RepID=A0A518XIB1_9GAMM|nr:4-alpha-glucanotransferase [Pantoea soli]QDY43917.1 4-alpha-glucanotransferase [Pantoea soli]
MKTKEYATPHAEGLIAPEYIDAHGRPQRISPQTHQRLARLIQAPPSQALPLPPVAIFAHGQPASLMPALEGLSSWQLVEESGQQWSGECAPGQPLLLPALPAGYHRLTLSLPSGTHPCSIIIAPARCYEPAELLAGESLWGSCIQLYTLRSARNWGIGDFGDLRQMVKETARRGGAFVGLNPLHALFPAAPESASPYSPSSRRWLNILYIDVSAIEDFQQSDAAQAWWQQASTQQALHAARESAWVDYAAVTALKLAGLRFAWRQFRRRDAEDAQFAAFESFVQAGGSSLLHQGLFDAMHAERRLRDGEGHGWQRWPEAWQQPDSAAVLAFRIEHSDDVRFYMWLQWLAAEQFAACWQLCQQQQMPIGLYRDLAVGVAADGAETWRERALYCLEASVGAPPDILGPLGQNWGLPPMDPQVMVARGYEPWITLLRTSMRDCGALRIDHVMALLRLWWIPQGETAAQGAYVHYPVDALLAILALESQRHRCMVIGEDLGTVPEAIVAKLRDAGVYSYKVLYFEQTHQRRFRAPADWPRQAMAVTTTHDMPTLRGWWQSDDLRLGSRLGLYPDADILAGLYRDRRAARKALLQTLLRSGALPPRQRFQRDGARMTRQLSRAIHRYLASTGCALLGLQPEEWLDMAQPVNVPGTVDQYPNWRRKLSVTLEEMARDPRIEALLDAVASRNHPAR